MSEKVESMHRFSKVLGILGLAAAVLLIGVGLGWVATRKMPTDPRISERKSTSINPEIPTRLPFFSTNTRPHRVLSSNKTAASPLATATNLVSDWEDKLDDILGSEGQDTDKAKQMLAMFPRLPEDAQVEVAQHVSNLLPDPEYAPLGKLLLDSKLPEAVLDVLIVDVLNRPNALKLPLLLEVARDPQHPKAGEAKDLLELYLEQDYGTDWNKWQAKLKQWMIDNPD